MSPSCMSSVSSVMPYASSPRRCSSSAGSTVGPKKPRLVFTDLQRRTLQAIFRETKRPSKEMQLSIAQQLGLDLSTVGNFFMNARRRSQDKWADEASHMYASLGLDPSGHNMDDGTLSLDQSLNASHADLNGADSMADETAMNCTLNNHPMNVLSAMSMNLLGNSSRPNDEANQMMSIYGNGGISSGNSTAAAAAAAAAAALVANATSGPLNNSLNNHMLNGGMSLHSSDLGQPIGTALPSLSQTSDCSSNCSSELPSPESSLVGHCVGRLADDQPNQLESSSSMYGASRSIGAGAASVVRLGLASGSAPESCA
jgi:hypothetical protein